MFPILPGAKAPFLYGVTSGGRFYSFENQAGRPAAVVVAHHTDTPQFPLLLDGFVQRSSAFAERDADIILLGNEDVVRAVTEMIPAASPICLVDCAANALPREAMVFVIDRNLRVAMATAPTVDAAEACLRSLDELPRDTARDEYLPAPILLLPNLLPREVCRYLIDFFEGGISTEGGIASIDANGEPCCKIDHRKKNRRDMMISPGEAMYDPLRNALIGRCAPELAKAFQAKITHIDRILIARYDAPNGWFLRHRDNQGPNVAFREFAISVNLNTEEYEGGHLTFPEYNDHRYRPPTGAGIIFSASILHEATAVLRGTRYVLLTFLHGEAAEAKRLAYEARAGVMV